MTRLRSITSALAAAAALSAGAAGATTIISTQGSNTLRIQQSPMGTVVRDGIGAHYVAPSTISHEPLVLRHPARDRIEEPSGLARLFMWLNPFDGFFRDRSRNRVIEELPPEVTTRGRARAMFDDVPGENRAVDMMRSIMIRMDR
ncbi:hypothetical protein [Pararhodobacter sp.]|uniref:hypothetical protein n=1 Tax=Pararhodobacter sp. TaxID=2127056 RepID=UPI002B0004EC|nr:hypothetical protein [Pararhodobacter sp.]